MASEESRIITSIDFQSHNDDRVSVFVDGDFAMGLHKSVAAKHGLAEGQSLPEDREVRIAEDESLVQAKQTALNYLAHKPRTEQEVRRRLQREDVAPPIVDNVLARMRELGYVDDAAYAEDYVRNRFQSKQYGPRRIQNELVKRGIDRTAAERAVDRFFADHDAMAAARSHAEKRWPKIARDDNPQRRKQKLYRYLVRRGFASGTVYRIIDEMTEAVP